MMGDFEVILDHLGAYLAAILRVAWGRLEPSWGHLGPMLAPFFACLRHCTINLGLFGQHTCIVKQHSYSK
jgi:hypothetical protein